MTFEEYLQTKHAEQYRGVDDDMPDDFERWLCDLGIEEIVKYAEKWNDEAKAQDNYQSVEEITDEMERSFTLNGKRYRVVEVEDD